MTARRVKTDGVQGWRLLETLGGWGGRRKPAGAARRSKSDPADVLVAGKCRCDGAGGRRTSHPSGWGWLSRAARGRGSGGRCALSMPHVVVGVGGSRRRRGVPECQRIGPSSTLPAGFDDLITGRHLPGAGDAARRTRHRLVVVSSPDNGIGAGLSHRGC